MFERTDESIVDITLLKEQLPFLRFNEYRTLLHAQDYAAAIKLHPNLPDAYALLADKLEQEGDYIRAFEQLTNAITLTPNDINFLAARAGLFILNKAFFKENSAPDVFHAHEQLFSADNQRCHELYEKQKPKREEYYADLKDFCHITVDNNPIYENSFNADFVAHEAFLLISNPTASYDTITKTLEIIAFKAEQSILTHAWNVSAWNKIGQVYTIEGHHEKAIQIFTVLLQVFKNNAITYCLKGYAHKSLNDLANAKACFLKSIEHARPIDLINLKPKRSDMLMTLNDLSATRATSSTPKLLKKHKNPKKMSRTDIIKQCTNDLKLNPENIYAYTTRGLAYGEIGKGAEAAVDLAIASWLTPDEKSTATNTTRVRRLELSDRLKDQVQNIINTNPRQLARGNGNPLPIDLSQLTATKPAFTHKSYSPDFENHVSKLIQEAPHGAKKNSYYALLEAYQAYGREEFDMAITHSTTALHAWPHNFLAELLRGYAHLANQAYREALVDFESVIKTHQHYQAYIGRSFIYLKDNQLPAALVDFKTGLALNTAEFELLNRQLAIEMICHLMQINIQTIEKNTCSPAVLYRYVAFYAQTSHSEASQILNEKIANYVQAFPFDTMVHFYYGMTIKSSAPAKARDAFSISILLDTQCSLSTLVNHACVCVALNDRDTAFKNMKNFFQSVKMAHKTLQEFDPLLKTWASECLSAGKKAFDNGDFNAAIELFKHALQDTHDHGISVSVQPELESWHKLAQAALNPSSDPVSLATTVLAEEPQYSTHLQSYRALIEANNLNQALNDFPYLTDIHVRLAKQHITAGNFAAAYKCYTTAIQVSYIPGLLYSFNRALHRERAALFKSNHAYFKKTSDYLARLTASVNDTKIAREEDREEASIKSYYRNDLTQHLPILKTSPELINASCEYFYVGSLAFNYSKTLSSENKNTLRLLAISYYEEAVRLFPDDFLSWNQLAVLTFKETNPHPAFTILSGVIKKYPQHPLAYFFFASYLHALKQMQPARDYFLIMFDLAESIHYPTFDQFREGIIELIEATEFQKPLPALEDQPAEYKEIYHRLNIYRAELYAMNPQAQRSHIYAAMGTAYYKVGQLNDAKIYLGIAVWLARLENSSRLEEYKQARAEISAAQTLPSNTITPDKIATHRFNQALEIDILFEDYRKRIECGNQHFEAGAYQQAAEQFTAAQELYPDFPEAYLGLGIVAIAQDQAASVALDYFKEAHRIDPEHMGIMVPYLQCLDPIKERVQYQRLKQQLENVKHTMELFYLTREDFLRQHSIPNATVRADKTTSIIDSDPKLKKATEHLFLGKRAVARNNTKLARYYFEEAYTAYPKDHSALHEIGCLISTTAPEKAREIFTYLIDHDIAIAFLTRGMIYFTQDKLSLAFRDFINFAKIADFFDLETLFSKNNYLSAFFAVVHNNMDPQLAEDKVLSAPERLRLRQERDAARQYAREGDVYRSMSLYNKMIARAALEAELYAERSDLSASIHNYQAAYIDAITAIGIALRENSPLISQYAKRVNRLKMLIYVFKGPNIVKDYDNYCAYFSYQFFRQQYLQNMPIETIEAQLASCDKKLSHLGLGYHADKHYVEARAAYTAAATKSEHDFIALTSKALCSMSLNESAAAAHDLDVVLKKHYHYSRALFARSKAYYNEQKFDLAKKYFYDAIIHATEQDILQIDFDPKTLARFLTEDYDLKSADVDLAACLATATQHIENKAYQAVLDTLIPALSTHMKNAKLLYFMADAYRHIDLNKATLFCSLAIWMSKDNPNYKHYFLRSIIHLDNGEFRAAILDLFDFANGLISNNSSEEEHFAFYNESQPLIDQWAVTCMKHGEKFLATQEPAKALELFTMGLTYAGSQCKEETQVLLLEHRKKTQALLSKPQEIDSEVEAQYQLQLVIDKANQLKLQNAENERIKKEKAALVAQNKMRDKERRAKEHAERLALHEQRRLAASEATEVRQTPTLPEPPVVITASVSSTKKSNKRRKDRREKTHTRAFTPEISDDSNDDPTIVVSPATPESRESSQEATAAVAAVIRVPTPALELPPEPPLPTVSMLEFVPTSIELHPLEQELFQYIAALGLDETSKRPYLTYMTGGSVLDRANYLFQQNLTKANVTPSPALQAVFTALKARLAAAGKLVLDNVDLITEVPLLAIDRFFQSKGIQPLVTTNPRMRCYAFGNCTYKFVHRSDLSHLAYEADSAFFNARLLDSTGTFVDFSGKATQDLALGMLQTPYDANHLFAKNPIAMLIALYQKAKRGLEFDRVALLQNITKLDPKKPYIINSYMEKLFAPGLAHTSFLLLTQLKVFDAILTEGANQILVDDMEWLAPKLKQIDTAKISNLMSIYAHFTVSLAMQTLSARLNDYSPTELLLNCEKLYKAHALFSLIDNRIPVDLMPIIKDWVRAHAPTAAVYTNPQVAAKTFFNQEQSIVASRQEAVPNPTQTRSIAY